MSARRPDARHAGRRRHAGGRNALEISIGIGIGFLVGVPTLLIITSLWLGPS